jgi:CheY-like chemotaxis protein
MIESGLSRIASFNYWNPVQFSSQFLPSGRQQSPAPSLDEHTSIKTPQKGRRALVVDDVSDVTDMLSVLLTHAGYEVSTASSARDAIAMAKERTFDMIISDIGMPEMNGYELARSLRSLPDYQAIPMVAVTGYSMFDDRDRSLNAGFNEHVTKPIDPRAFLELIEQL